MINGGFRHTVLDNFDLANLNNERLFIDEIGVKLSLREVFKFETWLFYLYLNS
jgi:hypothetical protein